MSDTPTPETDELARSLTYEQLASTEKCYSEMRKLARRLERERNQAREELNSINAERAEHRSMRKAWIELDDNRQILEKKLTSVERERDELRSDLEFRRGLFKLQEEQLNEVRAELDRIREERYQYRGLLIRLYNDLFVHHKGEAVREFKELFREENYN